MVRWSGGQVKVVRCVIAIVDPVDNESTYRRRVKIRLTPQHSDKMVVVINESSWDAELRSELRNDNLLAAATRLAASQYATSTVPTPGASIAAASPSRSSSSTLSPRIIQAWSSDFPLGVILAELIDEQTSMEKESFELRLQLIRWILQQIERGHLAFYESLPSQFTVDCFAPYDVVARRASSKQPTKLTSVK